VPELRKHIQFAFRPPDEFALTVDAGHDKLDGAERIAQRRHTVQGGHDETLGNRIAAKRQAVCADPRRVPVAIGGSGKVKRSATSCDGRKGHREGRKQTVSGRHSSNGMGGTPGETPGNHAGSPPRYSLEEMLDLQGLPRDLFGHSPLTMQGKRKFVGNAVTLPMACALARAVRMAMVE
jgi:site-specific DNA-cytosine methylase